MLREWNRLFPESWRNIWRKNVLVSSLTVSPNVVKYLNVPVFVSSLQPPSGDVLLLWFVILSREGKRRFEEHQAVSSVSPARQRQEKSRKSERIVSGKHLSPSATDSALPQRTKILFQLLVCNMHVNSNSLYYIHTCQYCGEFKTSFIHSSSLLVRLCPGAD